MANDNSSNILAGLAGLQVAGSVASGWAQSEALNAQASFATSMAKINQRFAAYRAADVLRQGDVEADRIRQQGLKVQGAQRASAAAQGIVADDGSAADAVSTTRELSADDQITTRNNAWRQAYGLQVQAQTQVNQARLQQSGARTAAAATLLGGALSGLQATSRMASYLNKSSTTKRTDGMTKVEATTPGLDNDPFNKWWE